MYTYFIWRCMSDPGDAFTCSQAAESFLPQSASLVRSSHNQPRGGDATRGHFRLRGAWEGWATLDEGRLPPAAGPQRRRPSARRSLSTRPSPTVRSPPTVRLPPPPVHRSPRVHLPFTAHRLPPSVYRPPTRHGYDSIFIRFSSVSENFDSTQFITHIGFAALDSNQFN